MTPRQHTTEISHRSSPLRSTPRCRRRIGSLRPRRHDPGDDGTKAPGPDAEPVGGGKSFQWGNSEATESDPVSPDDPMGGVTPGNGSVSVPVKNDGGDLSGPNGDIQNGAGEGDCIEVYVKATYRVWTKVSVSTTTSFTPEGIGGSRTETREYWEWIYYTYETEEKEVCPC